MCYEFHILQEFVLSFNLTATLQIFFQRTTCRLQGIPKSDSISQAASIYALDEVLAEYRTPTKDTPHKINVKERTCSSDELLANTPFKIGDALDMSPRSKDIPQIPLNKDSIVESTSNSLALIRDEKGKVSLQLQEQPDCEGPVNCKCDDNKKCEILEDEFSIIEI